MKTTLSACLTALLAMMATETALAVPYDQTRCFDIKLSGKVNYRSCRHYENPNKALYQEQAKTNHYTALVRTRIEKLIKDAWQPPMGFSGYLVDISYGLDDKGNLTYLDVSQNDLSESIHNVFEQNEPFQMTDNKDALENLKNNKMQIRIN